MTKTTATLTKPPCDAASTELAGLLSQVAEGDQKAFRKLYDLTHRRLFGVALLLLKSRDAAEDAVQEAFIRIWTRAASFDAEKGTPLPWMGRIVRNVAIDRVRRKTVWIDDLDDHHDTAAEAQVSGFAVADLNKCLKSLDPKHRAAWWMTHLDGISREEVAVRMQVPLGTVKSWVFRSSRRIRDAVEG